MKILALCLVLATSAVAQIDYTTQLRNQGAVRIPNAASVGTFNNALAKLTGAGTVVVAGTSDTSGVIGIVTSGGGTTGNAVVATGAGNILTCVFDNGITQGDYVQISTMQSGDCHDTGSSTRPTSGQVIGIVTSPTSGAFGTHKIFFLGPDVAGVVSLAVTSVFSRTGAVIAQSGDYTCAFVTNCADTTGSYANPSWITSLAYSKITGTPSIVNTFNGRTGTVVPTTGDYTAAQTTNAVDKTAANTYTGGGLQDLSAMKLKPAATTVGALPSAAANTNVVYLVTDGQNAIDCTTGSGATRGWCVSNGTNWLSLASAATAGVLTFNGRAGTVAPATADYVASQVTNAFDKTSNNTVSTGTQDFSGAAHTLPMAKGASLPGTCGTGELYFLTSATPGLNIYGCTAANTWSAENVAAAINSNFLSSNSAGQLVGRTITYTCTGLATSSTTLYLLVPSGNCTNTNISGSVYTGAFGSVSVGNLTVTAGTGGVNGSSGVVTVLVLGIGSTSVTCTLGTGTSCSDNAHSYTATGATSGVQFLIQVTTQAAETLANLTVSFTY